MRFPKNTISTILITILAILTFRFCQKEKQYSKDLEELLLLNQQQEVMLIDADENIHASNVAIVEANGKIKKLLDTIKHIKDPKVITKVRTVTKLDTVFVPFETFKEKEIDGKLYIKVPQAFLKIDKWYTIKGTVKNNGVFFDSMSYRNDFYIATGTQDHGSFIKNVFKPNRTIVTIKDNNPYTVTKTLQQTIVNTAKNRWHLGPNASLFYNGEKFVPTVGLGVTYSLLSF